MDFLWTSQKILNHDGHNTLSKTLSIFISTIAVSLCLHTNAANSSNAAVIPPSIVPKTFYNGILAETHDGELANVFGFRLLQLHLYS